MMAADYMLFYSTSFDAGTLKFGSMNIDIIFVAIIQVMTYIVVWFVFDRVPRVKTYNITIILIFMTIVIICILHYGFNIQVQKNLVISFILVIGIKVNNSVIDIVVWSYGSEIFPSNLRGIAWGIMI